jgi:hypothetical protein
MINPSKSCSRSATPALRGRDTATCRPVSLEKVRTCFVATVVLSSNKVWVMKQVREGLPLPFYLAAAIACHARSQDILYNEKSIKRY